MSSDPIETPRLSSLPPSLAATLERAKTEARRRAEDPEYQAALAREAREQAARDEENRKAETVRNRTAEGIPRRIWPVLDAPRETAALAAVRAFMANKAQSLLVLAGGVGTGKTVAAAWLLDQWGGVFLKAIEVATAGAYDHEFWSDLRATLALVIDDVGTEPRDEKGWAAANFAALLDYRYDHQRKTILTTNLTAERFRTVYGDARTLDRLREAGAFIAIPGESLRQSQQLALVSP